MYKLALLSLSASYLAAAQYTATYSINNLPNHSENGQSGTNKCSDTNSQSSECQTLVVNGIDDFCLWGPPEPNSAVGSSEEIVVAWCTKDGHGTRTIPQGALTGVHVVQTPDYIQITGVGDLSKMNINAVGGGGELDPHGATGNGNPVGGLVFSDAFGPMQQIHEWTNFMSEDQFCIRACKPGPNAWLWCNHIYDVMGCMWNMPSVNGYNDGVFETCQGDSGTPMGLYPSGSNKWGSTFHQGQPSTPSAAAAGASSQCSTVSNLGLGAAAPAVNTQAATTSKSSSSSIATSSSTSTKSSSVVSTSSSSETTSTSISSTTSIPAQSAAKANNVVPTSSISTSDSSKLVIPSVLALTVCWLFLL